MAGAARGSQVARIPTAEVFSYYDYLLAPPPPGQVGLSAEQRYEFYELVLRLEIVRLYKVPIARAWKMIREEPTQSYVKKKFESLRYEDAIRVRTIEEHNAFLGLHELANTIPTAASPAAQEPLTGRFDPEREFYYQSKFKCLLVCSGLEGTGARQVPLEIRLMFFHEVLSDRLVALDRAPDLAAATAMVKADPTYTDKVATLFQTIRLEDALRIKSLEDIAVFLRIHEIFGDPPPSPPVGPQLDPDDAVPFADPYAYYTYLLAPAPEGQVGLPDDERYKFYELIVRASIGAYLNYSFDDARNTVEHAESQRHLKRKFASFRYEDAVRARTKAQHLAFLGLAGEDELQLFQHADPSAPRSRAYQDADDYYSDKLRFLFMFSGPEETGAPQISFEWRYSSFLFFLRDRLVAQGRAPSPELASVVVKGPTYAKDMLELFLTLRLEDAMRVTSYADIDALLRIDAIFGDPHDKDPFCKMALYPYAYFIASPPKGQLGLSEEERYCVYEEFVEVAIMRAYGRSLLFDTCASLVAEPSCQAIMKAKFPNFRYVDAKRAGSVKDLNTFLGVPSILAQAKRLSAGVRTASYPEVRPRVLLSDDDSTVSHSLKTMCLFASPAPPTVTPVPKKTRFDCFCVILTRRLIARRHAHSQQAAKDRIDTVCTTAEFQGWFQQLEFAEAIRITTARELDDFIGYDMILGQRPQVFGEYRDYENRLCLRLRELEVANSLSEASNIVRSKDKFVKQRFQELPSLTRPRTTAEYDSFLGIDKLCDLPPSTPGSRKGGQTQVNTGSDARTSTQLPAAGDIPSSEKDIDELVAELELTGKSTDQAASKKKKNRKKKGSSSSSGSRAEAGDDNDINEQDEKVDSAGATKLQPTTIEQDSVPVAPSSSSSQGLPMTVTQNEPAAVHTDTSAAAGGSKNKKKKKTNSSTAGLQLQADAAAAAGGTGEARDETVLANKNSSLKPAATTEEEPAPIIIPDDGNIPQSQTGNTGESSSAASSSAQIKYFQDDQPQVKVIEPTAQALKDQFHRLTLRGMDSLQNVTRAILDQYALNNEYYYDAILPQRDTAVTQTGYEPGNDFLLDTNMFAVKFNRDEFFSYVVKWNPPIIGNRSLRSSKVRVWKKACDVSRSRWSQKVESAELTKFGPGAWDMGQRIYRYDQIPDSVLNDPTTNPLTFDAIVQTLTIKGEPFVPARLYSTTLEPVELTIDKKPSRFKTNVSDFTTTGCNAHDSKRWEWIRDALGSIFHMFPAWTMDWIEDWRRSRLFYPTGYIREPNVAYPEALANVLRDAAIHSPANVNDLFVFRRGCRAAPKLYPGGVYVNMWTCFAPFFGANLTVAYAIDVVLKMKSTRAFDGSRALTTDEINWLREALKHIRVETKLTTKVEEYQKVSVYPRRYYRIYGFSEETCGTLKVPLYKLKDGRLSDFVSGYDAFLPFCRRFYEVAIKRWPEVDFKNVDIALKNLPAVKVHPKYHCYLPPWALHIKENDKHGVKPHGILTDSAFRMRKALYEKRGAKDYIDFLSAWARTLQEQDECLKAFGVEIDPTPLRVKAVRLQPPYGKLHAGDINSAILLEPRITPHSWQRRSDSRGPANVKLVKYGDIKEWMVLHFNNAKRKQIYDWMEQFRKSNNLGMNDLPALRQRATVIHDCGDIGINVLKFRSKFLREAMNEFEKLKGKGALPDVVFLFLPQQKTVESGLIYAAFKYVCDLELGLKSQVIGLKSFATSNSRDHNDQRVDDAMFNLLLKFNKKIGGTNISLSGPWDKGTMIFGADVTHATGERVKHSIASIVATIDMPPTTYAARVTIQCPNQEMIQETEDMVTDLVRTFHKRNPNILLENVFFFRDGVGNDQVWEVLAKEIPAIFKGLKAGGASPRVKLVLLIALKRHHTRFWDRTSGEMQPGTVVNELPIYPLQTSFYLCSHLHPPPDSPEGFKKGVCRSTLYHILVDQMGLTLPHLQTLMYHLCYTYEKTSSTLSSVPALHYAHLACTRGRHHYQELVRSHPDVTLPDVRRPMRWGDAYQTGVVTDLTAHANVRDTMYYL